MRTDRWLYGQNNGSNKEGTCPYLSKNIQKYLPKPKNLDWKCTGEMRLNWFKFFIFLEWLKYVAATFE